LLDLQHTARYVAVGAARGPQDQKTLDVEPVIDAAEYVGVLRDTDLAPDGARFGHQQIAGGDVAFEQAIDNDSVGDNNGAADGDSFANVKGI
jgi:hypothetical protein